MNKYYPDLITLIMTGSVILFLLIRPPTKPELEYYFWVGVCIVVFELMFWAYRFRKRLQ